MNLQAIMKKHDASCPFTMDAFFYCERCACEMLVDRCRQRLQRAVRKDRHQVGSTVESLDVHCLQCEQGKKLTGLWVNAPYRICSVLYCSRPATSNGLCGLHYMRQRYGIKSKICATCGQDIALADYHKMTKSPDGRQYSCRECMGKKSIEQWERKQAEAKAKEGI